MARDAYLEHLAKVPLFAGCATKDLRLVARTLTELDVAAGEEVLTEGDRATSFLIVVDGRLDVHRGGRTVATVGPGAVLGEMAILTDRPRNATVRAATPAVVLVGDRRSFEPLLDEVPGLAKSVLYTLAGRVADNEPYDFH